MLTVISLTILSITTPLLILTGILWLIGLEEVEE